MIKIIPRARVMRDNVGQADKKFRDSSESQKIEATLVHIELMARDRQFIY